MWVRVVSWHVERLQRQAGQAPREALACPPDESCLSTEAASTACRRWSWLAEIHVGWHESSDFFDSPRNVAPSRSQVVVFVAAALAIAAPLTQLHWAGGVPPGLWAQPRFVVSPLFLDLLAGVGVPACSGPASSVASSSRWKHWHGGSDVRRQRLPGKRPPTNQAGAGPLGQWLRALPAPAFAVAL